MSRAHYERELHNTMEAKRSKAKGPTTDCTLDKFIFLKAEKQRRLKQPVKARKIPFVMY